mgnify:FL=1
MPSPFTNGAIRADGPPHDLYLGVERTPGPPHDLYLGVVYGDDTELPDVILGLVDVYAGENTYGALSLTAQFSLDVYAGANVFADVIPSTEFTPSPEFHDGSELTVDRLSTLPTFVIDFYSGEYNTNPTFDVHPAITLGYVYLYMGENGTADVEKYTFVGADHRSGEYTSLDLEIEPYEGLQSQLLSGEYAEVEVQITPGFIFSLPVGETANVDALGTTVILFPTAYTGEVFTPALTDNPPWNPTFDFTDGATFDPFLNLGSSSFGAVQVYTGGVLEATVDTRPGSPFEFSILEGQTANLAMSFAQNLGATEAYEGITLIPETIEFDELWKMFDGATASISMATSDAMTPSGYEGAYAVASVDVRPSEPLGHFDAREGVLTSLGAIAALKAVYMSVNFADSYMFQAGLPYLGSYFDLDVSCCTDHDPGQQEIHSIEMNHAPFPDEHYDGDRVRIDADLSTNVRFSFDFKTGETASNVDTVPYILGVGSRHGESLTVDLESVINFALCPGNFIPDGDNIFVELDFNDSSDCEAHYIRAGESFTIGTLEASQNFQPAMYAGETAFVSITIEDGLYFVFRTGETLILPVELGGASYEGASMRFSFYEPPIIAAHGEHVESDLVIKYDVRFEEVGCLDNEFIYQDENGDPIPEKFNPVPVELDPYQHDIRAICQ